MLQQLVPDTKLSAMTSEVNVDCGQSRIGSGQPKGPLEKRQTILQARGSRALRALQEWVRHNGMGLLPESFLRELAVAIRLMGDDSLEAVAVQLATVAETLVQTTEYRRLSLQDVALVACLAWELVELSDAMSACQTNERTAHPPRTIADRAIFDVARRKGRFEDLVPLLAEVLYRHEDVLSVPKDVSADELRSLLTANLQDADLPGICIAIWAASHGHLAHFSGEIVERVAALATERATAFEEDESDEAGLDG